jgi:CHAT domain-containing protein
MEEAENITSIFGGKSITGNRATETTFKKNASENKILHLAMHTIIDNEFPMYSKLVFSATKDTTDDGFLNTYELYNLDLKTPLLVLSACNTGYGKLMKGEGIISLARGFIYAGCPSMVITLWSVADRSSSDLMQLFYRNLNQKQNIDKSLQNAKIKYIQNSDQRMSHPYYWAGYIQTGKTIPVIKTKTHKLYVWPVAISIVIICFMGLVYFRKKSRNRSE